MMRQDLSRVFDRHQMPLILSWSKDADWSDLWFDTLAMSG